MRRRIAVWIVSPALAFGAGAAVPAAHAATAYTLEPLNFNLVESTARLFDGAVCEVYDCAKVPTPAALDLSYRNGLFGEDGPISQGAAALAGRLTADDGEKLVFGFSQGAQIANFWLRNYAPTSSVDATTTSFLLVGDPENTYGVPWTPNVPTNTGFAVTEVWSQYDGWADWPARFGLLAVANAVAGMFLVHPVVYDHLDLAAEQAAGTVVTWQADGISYQMVRNDTLPLLAPLRWVGLAAVADVLDAPLREKIEASYDRPATQPRASGMAVAAGAVAVRAAAGAAAIRSVHPATRIHGTRPARTDSDRAVPTKAKRAQRGA